MIKCSEHSGCFNIKKFLTFPTECKLESFDSINKQRLFYKTALTVVLYFGEKQYALLGVGSKSLNIMQIDLRLQRGVRFIEMRKTISLIYSYYEK